MLRPRCPKCDFPMFKVLGTYRLGCPMCNYIQDNYKPDGMIAWDMSSVEDTNDLFNAFAKYKEAKEKALNKK